MSTGPARLAGTLLVAWLAGGGQSPSPLPLDKPKSPVVAVVGCAAASPEPHIWILSAPARFRVQSQGSHLRTEQRWPSHSGRTRISDRRRRFR
jgi:hypothetical protein